MTIDLFNAQSDVAIDFLLLSKRGHTCITIRLYEIESDVTMDLVYKPSL